MPLMNDLFSVDGRPHHLLAAIPALDTCWIIDAENAQSKPKKRAWTDVPCLPALGAETSELNKANAGQRRVSRLARSRLEPMLLAFDDLLFDSWGMSFAVAEHVARIQCSPATLHKSLRRDWQRGEGESALHPEYQQRTQRPTWSAPHRRTTGRK